MEDTFGSEEIEQRHLRVGIVHTDLLKGQIILESSFFTGSCNKTIPAYLPSVDKKDYASFSAFKDLHLSQSLRSCVWAGSSRRDVGVCSY